MLANALPMQPSGQYGEYEVNKHITFSVPLVLLIRAVFPFKFQ